MRLTWQALYNAILETVIAHLMDHDPTQTLPGWQYLSLVAEDLELTTKIYANTLYGSKRSKPKTFPEG